VSILKDAEASAPESWTPCAGTSSCSPRPLRADIACDRSGLRLRCQPHSSESVQRVSGFNGLVERARRAPSGDCLRLERLSLAVGREHRGAVLADEVLPLLWGEIAAQVLEANRRPAFRWRLGRARKDRRCAGAALRNVGRRSVRVAGRAKWIATCFPRGRFHCRASPKRTHLPAMAESCLAAGGPALACWCRPWLQLTARASAHKTVCAPSMSTAAWKASSSWSIDVLLWV
jgi:hypothetical protein